MKRKCLFFLLAIIACGPKKEASILHVSEAGKVRLPMALSSMTGKREGYKANAELTFVDTGLRDTLMIRFMLEPGVPTKFLQGNYIWHNAQGDVTCSSVDFFGGQGGNPSIGGNFAFTVSEGSAYIIILPATELAAKK